MTGLRILACAEFRREEPSGLHALARALRRGEVAAVEAVGAMVVHGLAREAPDLAAADGVTVVPMAGHEAATASGAAALLVARLVAAHPGWSERSALDRIADAPRALEAGPRDEVAEAATLRWHAVPGAGPILLVDDVEHTGASLRAAWLAAPPEVRARLLALAAFRALD